MLRADHLAYQQQHHDPCHRSGKLHHLVSPYLLHIRNNHHDAELVRTFWQLGFG